MTADQLRSTCLALPGAVEERPFRDPEVTVYKAGGKIFAITRGNTNAPTIMIGQKGADLIRGRLPLPREQAAEEVGA